MDEDDVDRDLPDPPGLPDFPGPLPGPSLSLQLFQQLYETFDDLIGKRWKEEGMIEKVDAGFKDGIYQQYGNVLGAFEGMEKKILAEEKQT